MPKKQTLNQNLLEGQIQLFLTRSGPSTSKEVCQALGISQPSFSRWVSQTKSPILRIGKGKRCRYVLKRFGAWGKPEIPVYSMDESGTMALAATLQSILPQGFYLESNTEAIESRFYNGLPYLFEDLRPSGFLGRLLPRLHPDLELPEDIQAWTDEHCLKYLIQYGWDLPGNFILGEGSCNSYLNAKTKRPDVVPETRREMIYPQTAERILSTGIPGSSAGGEQPKFLSTRATGERRVPVLVKFSPFLNERIGRRVADLLVCEHIAHEVLRDHDHASSKSCLVAGENRLFLEVERFDRTIEGGRKGLLSLLALDLQFVGSLRSWSETAEALFRQKKIDHTSYQNIFWLQVFGKLIGNTDRHHGNVSFFTEGERLLGLAPCYDMLPMLYAPQQNQLVERPFDPPPPKASELAVWGKALSAARDFWSRVQSHPQISGEFKSLTAKNEQRLVDIPHRDSLEPGSLKHPIEPV